MLTGTDGRLTVKPSSATLLSRNKSPAPDIQSGAAVHVTPKEGPLTPEEFARRYEETRRTLWYIAAAIVGDRTQAHDIVQEAASIAMTKLDEFNPATNFTAWMGQIVRYVALNESRTRHRRRAAGTDSLDSVPTHGSHSPANTPDLDQHVAASLMSLEELPRTCLVLRVIHGLAYSEISSALNIPEGTAMSHVHRSRLALRERLRGREDELRVNAGGAQ